jgi:nicotinamidase-related amidase
MVSMSSAVVVIDVQESVLAGCADVPEVVKRINVLARRARQERVPVLFIQHEDPDDPELTRDSQAGSWRLRWTGWTATRWFPRHTATVSRRQLSRTC